jgi:CHAT domain-containing protein
MVTSPGGPPAILPREREPPNVPDAFRPYMPGPGAQDEARRLGEQIISDVRSGKPYDPAKLQGTVAAMTANATAQTMLPPELAPSAPPPAAGDAMLFSALGVFGPLEHDAAVLARIRAVHGEIRPVHARTLALWDEALAPLRRDDPASGVRDLAETSESVELDCAMDRSLELLANDPSVGPSDPRFVARLEDLAEVYRRQGAYEPAAALLARGLELREHTLGKDHLDVAASLVRLAEVYQERAAYRSAEPLLIRASAIVERLRGPRSREAAAGLHSLALLYKDLGDVRRAAQLAVQALDILEQTSDASSPARAACLYTLAEIYQAQGAYPDAERALAQATSLREARLEVELVRLSEPRKRAVMALLQDETEAVVSLHADAMATSSPELALTTVLRRKGRVLDAVAGSLAALHANLTPELRAQLDDLAEARAALVRLSYGDVWSDYRKLVELQSSGASGPEAQRALMAATAAAMAHQAEGTKARGRVLLLEDALARASVTLRSPANPVTLVQVQAALPPGAALVELVRYHRFDARQIRQPWREQRYVAYLLTPQGAPQAVPLGDAATIDAEVGAVLDAMHRATDPDAALRRLHARVFAPIRAHLPGTSHIIVAPDGALNRVPFEALIDARGHHAIEDLLVSYVTSGRDLLVAIGKRAPRSAAVILADPAFGPVGGGSILPPFCPLAGAAAELAALRNHFPAVLKAEGATKAAVMALAGPARLHVASHGFYFTDAVSPSGTCSEPATAKATDPADRGLVVQPAAALPEAPPESTALTQQAVQRHFQDEANSLDSAGIALAGANRGPEGIVTAREIAGLDLRGTQLVVLSACTTGLGGTPSGDGVYGLRRSLVLAGAESQVVTLWNVNDGSTPHLMKDYYDELARGTGRAEALRKAKLKMMKTRYAHPYFWAPFVFAGAWRPL